MSIFKSILNLYLKTKSKNNLFILVISLIFCISLNKINSQLDKKCEKYFFDCNGEKCSINGHCYFTSFDKNVTQVNATCICSNGYIDTPDTLFENKNGHKDKVKCCYKKKKFKLAFLGEAFFGFGFGYFYLENYTLFLIKLIINLSICFIFCFSGFFINRRKENNNNKIIFKSCNILNFILLFIFFVWRIIDFFIFGLNLVKDKNGVDLDSGEY
jgi:hypothetical protein